MFVPVPQMSLSILSSTFLAHILTANLLLGLNPSLENAMTRQYYGEPFS